MAERPIARGVFLCDLVITDRDTGYTSLINCFRRRRFPEFPTEPFSFVFYAELTNGSGTINLETVVTQMETGDDVIRSSVSHNFADPMRVVRFTLRFPRLSFPAPGDYEVVLGADGEMIGRLILHVTSDGDAP
jgi:hypothetical protein